MSHRLDAAIAARREINDASIQTFDALVQEVLLDRTGTRHMVLCLALNSLISHQCPKIGETLEKALNTALCSQSMTHVQNPENEPAALSSLTGRRVSETKVESWSFEVSPEIETWMANLFRRALESMKTVTGGQSKFDTPGSMCLQGRATVCRVTVSPEPRGGDFCVTCKTYTRATPHVKFLVAKGREARALQCLWNFYQSNPHPGRAEDYVKSMSEATVAFGPNMRDVVPDMLANIYAEYVDILKPVDSTESI